VQSELFISEGIEILNGSDDRLNRMVRLISINAAS